MLAEVVRSGLTESIHDGVVAVVGCDGRLLAQSGEVTRPFYFRSIAKPFQAAVCGRLGARLSPYQLAVAAASHDGDPVHLAIVESILAEAALTAQALRCPPSWPLGTGAARRAGRAGEQRPRPLWNNCSGKHAAMLAACRARGWSTDDYLEAHHPLQTEISRYLGQVGGADPGPVGVDGCGVPVFRGTAVTMARAYARLAGDPELAEVYAAMHRYPALASGYGNADAAVGIWTMAVAKRGAEGCFGVAVKGRLGLVVKAWDGSWRGAQVGMLEALRQLGVLNRTAEERLRSWSSPPVMGGGRAVGSVRPRLELIAP